jgi:hypothetical protein
VQEVFRFFHDSSLVVWDGTRYTGGGDIKAFWKALPSTSHDVKSLDAQPISGSVQGAACECALTL